MVGKTRLYQHAGSPLIRGASKRRPLLGRVILWVIAVAAVAVAAAYVYLSFLR
jgi:type VI protein secretion system component VasF